MISHFLTFVQKFISRFASISMLLLFSLAIFGYASSFALGNNLYGVHLPDASSPDETSTPTVTPTNPPNVRPFEETITPNATTTFTAHTVTPTPTTAPIDSSCTKLDFTAVDYSNFRNYGYDGGVTLEDGGETLKLTGNTWQESSLIFKINPDTVLYFEFKSTEQGELHGIGTRFGLFIVYGVQYSQNGFASSTGFRDYVFSSPDWKAYQIPIGAFLEDSFAYQREADINGNVPVTFIFVNDKDYGQTTHDSYFRNVEVCLNGATPVTETPTPTHTPTATNTPVPANSSTPTITTTPTLTPVAATVTPEAADSAIYLPAVQKGE